MSGNPRWEHPSTYVVQDRDNQEELARLQSLDKVATQSAGGVLPEQPDPTSFKRVLDIGCGTGGWLIETAKTYPHMTQLFGIDISSTILGYARSQAEAHQVSDRVEFVVMDALRMLEFPSNFFDLVNMRFGQSYLRTWDWPKLLQEALRVSKPGGVIRFTEGEFGADSSSQAYNRLAHLSQQALYQAGHYFTPDGNGATVHLAQLMRRHGVRNIQTRTYSAKHRVDTPEGALFTENVRLVCRTAVPFFRKWIRLPDDYEDIYRQAVADMQAPDFVATWNFLTAWGNK
jgi:ubiquinone/menaquinone biosynthesis C-methylase UbiE